jgi:protein MpaA
MHRHNGYPVLATMGYPTPGSLGSWAGIDRQIPIVTLELPREDSGTAAWAQNKEALLAAIAAERPR